MGVGMSLCGSAVHLTCKCQWACVWHSMCWGGGPAGCICLSVCGSLVILLVPVVICVSVSPVCELVCPSFSLWCFHHPPTLSLCPSFPEAPLLGTLLGSVCRCLGMAASQAKCVTALAERAQRGLSLCARHPEPRRRGGLSSPEAPTLVAPSLPPSLPFSQAVFFLPASVCAPFLPPQSSFLMLPFWWPLLQSQCWENFWGPSESSIKSPTGVELVRVHLVTL